VSVLQRARDWTIHHLRKRSVVFMARAACWVALVGLAVMCSSIIRPMPLLIIFAMSVGQVIGIAVSLGEWRAAESLTDSKPDSKGRAALN